MGHFRGVHAGLPTLASALEVFRLFAQVGAGSSTERALLSVLGLLRRPRVAHSVTSEACAREEGDEQMERQLDSTGGEPEVVWSSEGAPDAELLGVAAAYEVACSVGSVTLKAAVADALLGTVCGADSAAPLPDAAHCGAFAGPSTSAPAVAPFDHAAAESPGGTMACSRNFQSHGDVPLQAQNQGSPEGTKGSPAAEGTMGSPATEESTSSPCDTVDGAFAQFAKQHAPAAEQPGWLARNSQPGSARSLQIGYTAGCAP